MSKKAIPRKISIQLFILLLIILSIPIIYFIIWTINPDYSFLGGIYIGIAFVFLLILVLTTIFRNRRYVKTSFDKHSNEKRVLILDEDQNVRSAYSIREKLTLAKEKELRKKITLKIRKFNHEVNCEGRQCKLSKIYFGAKDIGVYCPKCGSLYKKQYLINWLLRNPTCPICRETIIQL